jgi:O-antigen/teichoic acid export membrane protein
MLLPTWLALPWTECLMTTDALRVQREERESSLTWRASLNLAQSVLDYSAKLVVGLIVIPIVVGGLGRSLFGVWEMLGRLAGYLESTDGRPTQALRLVISNRQSQADPFAKRRWVGSALVVWLCFLPLWIVTGAVLIWLAPTITKVGPDNYSTVRLACGVMMVGVLLGGLASLPESVLRGMNLGYKRMGVQAGLSLVGGSLVAGAAYLGLGLIGVALAGVVLTILTGLCFLRLVRHQVAWFGAERPNRSEVGSLFRMSLWIAGGDAVAKLLLASDVIVLGMVLSPATVTTYVLTGYAALLAVNLHSLAADAVIPGLAGIIGEKSYPRAALLRRELLAVTTLFVTAAGSTILLWNPSFVHLWVGGENYAGLWTNFLLVLIAAQTAFIRCDAYIIDAALQPGCRVRVSAVAAAIALSLSVVLTWYWGMPGLCLGILAGRATQTIWYPILVRGCLAGTTELSPRWLLRPLLMMGAMFAATAYLGQLVAVRHWLTWAAVVPLTVVVVLGISLQWGLPTEVRSTVRARLADVIHRLGRTDPWARRP